MQKTILFNGKTVPVFHVEAGDFYPARRVEVPSGEEFVLDDVWSRKFLILTDKQAIEITIDVSEIIVPADADVAESKYARAYRNFPKWREETSGDKIQEIILATPRAMSGKIVFADGGWPATWIYTRDLKIDEKAIVLQQMAYSRTVVVESLSKGKLQDSRLARLRRKGGASSFKLAGNKDAYHFLISDVKRRMKLHGNMARAIRESRHALYTKFPDVKDIKLSNGTIRNIVLGKTGMVMKRNFKR